MTIKVRLFAILRDKAQRSEMMLELPEGSTVGMARERIAQAISELKPYLERSAFALNQIYVKSDAKVSDGDELALIPPVSGGIR